VNSRSPGRRSLSELFLCGLRRREEETLGAVLQDGGVRAVVSCLGAIRTDFVSQWAPHPLIINLEIGRPARGLQNGQSQRLASAGGSSVLQCWAGGCPLSGITVRGGAAGLASHMNPSSCMRRGAVGCSDAGFCCGIVRGTIASLCGERRGHALLPLKALVGVCSDLRHWLCHCQRAWPTDRYRWRASVHGAGCPDRQPRCPYHYPYHLCQHALSPPITKAST
jgi:hypothetical protein